MGAHAEGRKRALAEAPVAGATAAKRRAEPFLAGLIAIIAAVGLAMSLGVLRPLEDGFATLRFALLHRPASGQITVVAIDVKSLRAAERWPWGRERFATAIRNLQDAGASLVGFDVDFSATSSDAADAALAEAIRRQPGSVVLPTFVQPANDGAGGTRLVETSPLKGISSDALLASVNVPVDDDGRVRRYGFGFGAGEAFRPSMGALLANAPYGKSGAFLIDYSVKAADIPRLSFEDVYENRFDKTKVKGRAILVGATALELGDEFATQQAGTLSGVFVHALGFESILAGRALISPHPLAVFGLASLLVFILRPTRRGSAFGSCLQRHLVAGGLIFVAPIGIQALTPVSLPVAPLVLAQVLCIGWAARTELARRAQAIIREREAGLLQLAMHDPETELPNRRALLADIALRAHPSKRTAVITIGLDRYALMRGVVGYGLASRAMREVAARLADTSPGAAIAHLSTSVLGLAIIREDDDQLACEIRRLEALSPRYTIEGHQIDLFLKLGVAFATSEAVDGERLLEQATIALDEARRLNRASVTFDPSTFVDRSGNLALMSEMSLGLAAGHLSMHYQPKASATTGEILGVEGLVRWRHPERGNIPPDAFIGTAEETGAIRELTEWTLVQAAADSRRLRALGHRLMISVNISGRLLAESAFCDRVLALVGDQAGTMCLEITETAVIDRPDDAMAAIARFHSASLKVSIDDYGVGLSSLSYLKMLHADELKVDKSLVVEVSHSQRDRLILKSTVDLAHSLGMSVVAEGVETADVLASLRLLGCDLVQGYLIAKPLPLIDLERLLEERRNAADDLTVAETALLAQG